VTSSSKEIKPIVLSIVELCLHLAEDRKFRKFKFYNLLEGSQHFGLGLTNAAKLLKRKCEAGFWVILFSRKSQTPMILIIQYYLTVLIQGEGKFKLD